LVEQYNVSPKLAHSGNSADLALNSKVLGAWFREPKANFKFVLASPDDVGEVLVLQQEHGIESGRIFLMPEGRDSETLRERSGWLAKLCGQHGFNFTDRLHIHLYGDTRGT
jgi:hypothetical protein